MIKTKETTRFNPLIELALKIKCKRFRIEKNKIYLYLEELE